jgi:hypothetical protein
MFAFLVGPEHVRFEIHSGILEELSQPLTRLMKNGSMKESTEKEAVLDDIEVDTFAQFANYCYSGNYQTTPIVATDIEFDGTLISGNQCHYCQGYYVTVSRKGTTYCSQCSPFGPAHVVSASLPATFADRKYGSTQYTHDEIRSFLDNQMPKDEPTARLREHAKVYVMADRYLVPSLKALAIHKLHRDLVKYDMRTHGAGEVVELLRYTYTNTLGVDDAEGTDNELRDLIATYAAWKAPELLKDKGFREMLEEGGEAAFGFACFLAKRLQ